MMPDPQNHPLADLFPLMPAEDLDALASDVAANGLRQPIILLDGQILDGRNRLAACKQAGVEPRFEDFNGDEDDALAFVLSSNLHRRHLTTAQRAVLALRLLPLEQERAARRKSQAAKDGQNFAGAEGKATEVAGTRVGVSGETVRQAARLAETAPDVLKAVDQGLVGTMPEALRLAAVPEARRPQVIERLRDMGGGRVSDADNAVRREEDEQRQQRQPEPLVVIAPGVRLLYGVDVREGLRSLDERSVHAVVTSPPYWGLRDYDTPPVTWPDGWRGHLGLEPTPRLYVEHLVEVFREVRRVLRDDGTLWLVIGDCYFGSSTSAKDHLNYGQHMETNGRWTPNGTSPNHKDAAWPAARRDPEAYSRLKPKDLVGIPWRVAFALQDDGWFLRADIVWQKPSVLPDPVKDRPTRSHEYVFLFTKSPDYYYDQDAIREPFSDERRGRDGSTKLRERNRGGRTDNYTKANGIDPSANGGRNRRTVWTVATVPYHEDHFAAFPPALVEPMILAGTSEKGCCPKCGSPYRRVVDREQVEGAWQERQENGHPVQYSETDSRSAKGTGMPHLHTLVTTTGWQATCGCRGTTAAAPCTVLDPFSGSATTGMVARQHGRSYVGIDLSEKYLDLARKRIGLPGT